MKALELADWADDLFSSDGQPKEVAAMLRKQRESIVKLREALEEAKAGLEWYQSMVPAYTDGSDDEAMERINLALKDTEDLK